MSLVAASQRQLAETIGICERTFATWIQEGCPGSPRNYVVCEIIEWARENKWYPETDGELLDSIDDEKLKRELIRERIEKLRRENQLADFKIGERDANLVDVSVIRRFLAEFSGRIRSAISTIEKKHGNDSCSPIRGALDITEKELNGGVIDCND